MQHTEKSRCTRLPINTEELGRLCRRHGVRKLSLFGSRLKGTARPDSDVDLLVEFMPDATPTLLYVAEIEDELSKLMGGVPVDLRTAQELSRYVRDQLVQEAEVQYAASGHRPTEAHA